MKVKHQIMSSDNFNNKEKVYERLIGKVAKRQGGNESAAKRPPYHFTTLPFYQLTNPGLGSLKNGKLGRNNLTIF